MVRFRYVLSLHNADAVSPWGQAVTKRAGRKAAAAAAPKATGRPANNKAVVRKAIFETSRKKEVGVSDLTLLSKISNEAINENLRKRFEHHEIYVSLLSSVSLLTLS